MNFTLKKTIICSILLILFLSDLKSQVTDSVIIRRQYQTVYAVTAPAIDGKHEDECWNLTEWSSDFIQSHPAENKPPSQQTAFKILYDNDNLYVFIRAFDTEPDKISRIMSRRDNFNGDMVYIEIDSYYDKQTNFLFVASASGTKCDAVISQNGENEDESWNPVWYLETAIDNEGWNAEMKIPLSQLRFGKKESQIWGLEVTRVIHRLQERSLWQFIPKGSPGRVHLFGELQGINNIKPKHQTEILPYTVARTERFEKVEGDPFRTGNLNKLSAGLDGKVALTNDFTLDFTFNPDFGQVEADPSEVNLTAFESYFSERRPFFVEGKNIFDFTPSQSIVIHNMYSDNLFYSRRIGRYPHNYPDVSSGEFVRMPESTTILGALKISGKTKRGLSLGILESVTSAEEALIDNAGSRRRETVEPFTNYFTGRIRQDFNKGETTIGGIITAVNRNIDSPVLEYLHSAAYTGGIDFRHNWKDRTWYVAGNAEFSSVRGKPAALIATQRSSARYYQRPDASHLSVDSSLLSLGGFGSSVKLGKSSQKKLQFETSLTMRSPGLEFNDIGYMRSSDIIHHGTWVAYYIRNPFAVFNNFFLNTNYWMYWNFSGDLLSKHTNINFNSQFKNRWRLNGQFNMQSESISTTLLRGGPSFIKPGTQSFNINIGSDPSKKVSFFAGNYYGSGDVNSYLEHEYYASLNIRPANSISISIEPAYSISKAELQYITQTTDNDNNDNVYLFGKLDQKTLSLTFRVNYTINPELSLEYYGQPFISAGKYSDFKEITQPKADKFRERFYTYSTNQITFDSDNNSYSVDQNLNNNTDFTFSNPDFNFSQFRSNFVIRWEYLPGSTVYLVWSQGRTGNDSNGRFSYGSDMKDLFHITPHNVFLLKLSYWFAI